MLFRNLTEKEEKEFRQWARENYKKFSPISGVWHPVVQDECVRINSETGYAPSKADPFGAIAEYTHNKP